MSVLVNPSCAGGMAKKRRSAELPERRQHRHPCRPQPHHQRGPAVRFGQLHLSGQQHRGKETQRHGHRDSLWYAVLHTQLLSLPVTTHYSALTPCLHGTSHQFVCLPAPLHKWLRDLSLCFHWRAMFSFLFRWMYYSKTQFTASHLKSMCTLWKEISHCVLISFKRSVAH